MTWAPAELLAARHAALARDLVRDGLDALVVTNPSNVAYLTGFFGSAALLLATPARLVLLSDTRYAEALADLTRAHPALDVEIARPGESTAEEGLAAHVPSAPDARVGFESASMSVRQHLDLDSRLRARGLTVTLVGTDGLVESLRTVKDAWEVQTLRAAGRRLSDVAKCIIPKALAGSTERELAAVIEWELRQHGFERPAFDTIVAAGPNAARPHHRAGERPLAPGDLVVIDFGGVFGGYAVDMTRTVTVGAPTERQRQCLQAVAEAQRAAFAVARAGVAPEDVDAAARRVLDGYGMVEAFVHGLGHGLGLDVHERPRLAPRRPGVAQPPIAAGMVFTLEPGVYFPGWGGVRIEDDVLVTAAGPEWLTDGADGVRAT